MINNIGMQGRYQMTAYKLDGSSRVLADWFENLILDNGLNGIESNGGMLGACFVGSGTAAVTAVQTQLANLVASQTDGAAGLEEGNNTAGGFAWLRRRWRFGQGVAAGNLSEVGVGSAATNLFSRARITDTSGTPTTITVLADEFLDVTYEFRVYWPTTDATGTINVGGTNTNFVMRAARVQDWDTRYLSSAMGANNNWFGWYALGAGSVLGDIFGQPSGGGSIGGLDNAGRVGSYTNGSFSRTFRVNAGLSTITQPIATIMLQSGGINQTYFQVSFDPPIPKSGLNVFNADFTLSWARRSI